MVGVGLDEGGTFYHKGIYRRAVGMGYTFSGIQVYECMGSIFTSKVNVYQWGIISPK